MNIIALDMTEEPTVNSNPDTPLRVWLLTQVIMLIPLVNLIMLCVWAFNKQSKYPSRQQWAISNLLIMLAVLVVYGIILMIWGADFLWEKSQSMMPTGVKDV